MQSGDSRTMLGIVVTPADNIIHKLDNGQVFHPKGFGNGYVPTFGDKRVYVAEDTNQRSITIR